MEKKNILALGLLVLALLIIVGGVYYLYTEREKDKAGNLDQKKLEELPPMEETGPMPYDDFLLTHKYVGNNTWNYEVTEHFQTLVIPLLSYQWLWRVIRSR